MLCLACMQATFPPYVACTCLAQCSLAQVGIGQEYKGKTITNKLQPQLFMHFWTWKVVRFTIACCFAAFMLSSITILIYTTLRQTTPFLDGNDNGYQFTLMGGVIGGCTSQFLAIVCHWLQPLARVLLYNTPNAPLGCISVDNKVTPQVRHE